MDTRITNLTSKLTLIVVLLTALITFTSCDPEDDDVYMLSGEWIYQGNEYGDFYSGDENEFYFSPGGTGTYSCYSDGGYGPWTTYPIQWWVNGDYITIQVSDWDVWVYSFDLTPGWLYLYPDDGGPYLIYSHY